MSRLKINERLSLTISLFALAASLFTMYFQFFHKEDNLSARVLTVGNNEDTTTTMVFAVTNSGNRDAVLINASLFSGGDQIDDRNELLPCPTEKEGVLPAHLPPNKSTVIRLTFKVDFNKLKANSNYNMRSTFSKLSGFNTTQMMLTTIAVNGNGTIFTSRDPFMTIDWTDKGINEIKVTRKRIDLFKSPVEDSTFNIGVLKEKRGGV